MATLTLAAARTELWNTLGNLSCNWTDSFGNPDPSQLDTYLNRYAREAGISFPLTDTSQMKAAMIWAEIYALEHLANNAINNTRVTMGGKTIDLQQIFDHIQAKLKRLYQLIEEDDSVRPPYSSVVNVEYSEPAEPYKRDARPTQRSENNG